MLMCLQPKCSASGSQGALAHDTGAPRCLPVCGTNQVPFSTQQAGRPLCFFTYGGNAEALLPAHELLLVSSRRIIQVSLDVTLSSPLHGGQLNTEPQLADVRSDTGRSGAQTRRRTRPTPCCANECHVAANGQGRAQRHASDHPGPPPRAQLPQDRQPLAQHARCPIAHILLGLSARPRVSQRKPSPLYSCHIKSRLSAAPCMS